MRRCLGIGCAGVLLLAAAGCTMDKFLVWQVMSYGPKTVVPGTVAEVAAKLQDGLSDAGLLLQPKRMESEYRIASRWKSDMVFCLYLTPKKDAGGKKTQVRIKWDSGGDEELWHLILKILHAPSDAGEEEQAPQPGSP